LRLCAAEDLALAPDAPAGDDTGVRKIAAATLGATLALASLLAGCTSNGNAPASVTGKVVAATSAARLPPDSVPPYYITIPATAPGEPVSSLTVRSTRTGLVLATVHPPEDPGTFTFVSSSTSDDRTFLVGAQRWSPMTFVTPPDDSHQPILFYLLRFDPASRRTSLVPLPVPPQHERAPSIFLTASLSPDGTQLAVADVKPGGRALAVHVYPIPAGGAGRTWTTITEPNGNVWDTHLSWSANDRVVAVGQAYGTLWLLDTTAPAGDLVAASEAITLAVGMGDQYPGLGCTLFPIVLTSDGSKLVCAVDADYDRASGRFRRGGFAFYSPVTGDMTGVAAMERSGPQAAGSGGLGFFWVSPRGTIIIGSPLNGPVSVITAGGAHPIPWSAAIQAAAW
jgi:hypothetical protein